MSDPRWKNGIRSNWHKPQPEMDSPTCHGWVDIGQNEQGYTIFELGRAFMRATTPGERDRTDNDWLVFIGSEVYGFSGPLAKITHEVKVELGLVIPFMGELVTPPVYIGEAGL